MGELRDMAAFSKLKWRMNLEDGMMLVALLIAAKTIPRWDVAGGHDMSSCALLGGFSTLERVKLYADNKKMHFISSSITSCLLHAFNPVTSVFRISADYKDLLRCILPSYFGVRW